MGDGEHVPCDTYGHRSWFQVFLSNGGELSFCGHHGRANQPKLRDEHAVILDYTDGILA